MIFIIFIDIDIIFNDNVNHKNPKLTNHQGNV